MSPTYYFLQFIVMTTDGLSTGWLAEMLFGAKARSKSGKAIRIMSFWILVILICLPSFLLHRKILPILNLAAYFAGIAFLMKAFYGSGLKESGIFMLSYLVLSLISESISLMFMNLAGWSGYDWTVHPMMEAAAFGQFCMAALKLIYGKAVIRSRKKKISSGLIYFCFWLGIFCLPVALPLLYTSSTVPYLKDGDFLMVASSITLMIIPCIASAVFFFGGKKKSDQMLSHLQEYSESQSAYYESLEASDRKLEKIRHDYKNIMMTVRGLVREKRNEEALAMLEEFSDRMMKDEPVRYCPHPAINVILNEKSRICEDNGIRFKADILIDLPIRIQDLDLSIALGNILDNAIRAAKVCPKEERWISVQIRIIQNRLILTADNSCLPNPNKKIYGTGFGQQNIRETASRCSGTFRIRDTEAGQYGCTLILANPDLDETVSSAAFEEPEKELAVLSD